MPRSTAAAGRPQPVPVPTPPSPALRQLQHYRAKRDFARTPEPDGSNAAPAAGSLSFVVQMHHAGRLHYDFRLELDGVLLSWAVPKGPSLDPADKRMAVRTEDHPLAYAGFEGVIPPQQYGAGRVIVWDRGHWQPLGDPHSGLAQGKLGFSLHGHKLRGRWELIRLKTADERQAHWLLFKKRDHAARPRTEFDVLQALPDSVLQAGAPQDIAVGPAKTGASTRGRPRDVDADTDTASPAGAVPAPLPDSLGPQLATAASALPAHGHWVFEDKLDGYRLLARIDAGGPRLFTRNGHDWTDRLPRLVQALTALGVASAWLDGEIVVRGPDGQPDFNRLQNAFDRHRTQAVDYVLFDLPYFEGHDLRNAPLAARRDLLCQLLQARGQPPLSFSSALGSGGPALAAQLLRDACAARREGLIAKRDDAPYRDARGTSWLKLKCQLRQAFVLAGYTLRSDDDSAIGSLLLAVHDMAGKLHSAGSVGTGWSRAQARQLLQQLQPLRAAEPPFDIPPPGPGRWARAARGAEDWLRPVQVAEVGFAEWTPTGQVRHAVFIALRNDKPATAVVRERPLTEDAGGAADATDAADTADKAGAAQASSALPAPPAKRSKVAAVAPPAAPAPPASPRPPRLSHPDRVVDAASGTTKLQLAQFFEAVADPLLAQLRGRPVALLRAPGGVAGPVFFQKHSGDAVIPGARDLPADLWPGHAPLLELASRSALQGAAQMNVLEFHPWNARSALIAKPDRMVFDLDPGEGVPWQAMQEAALLVRTLLDQLGLQSWLKTSGGKGLHLVVPLAARWPFDTVKGFSKAVVQHLAQTIPQRFVAKSGPANRRGRIFVDYLRNGEGATTVAAWSPRARPGLGVSMPVLWDELDSLTSAAQWTVANAAQRLDGPHVDSWATMAGSRQSLTAPMRALDFQP